jgi:hypothetical protein
MALYRRISMPLSSEEEIRREFLRRGFSPFTINRLEWMPRTAGTTRDRELRVELRWGDVSYTFLAEVRRRWSPRALSTALIQAKAAAEAQPDAFPLLVTPFLPADAIDRLYDEQVSGIDLSGNGIVIVPNCWLVIRTGAKNRYPMSDPIKNVYRGVSSLVARASFIRPEYSSVSDLQEEIERRGGKLAMSTIYKVLQSLEEDLLVEREETIKFLQPDRLLDRLVENFRCPSVQKRVRGRVANRGQWLTEIVALLRQRGVSVACDSPARYAVMPGADTMVTMYASSLEDIERTSGFEETDRFPTIELRETDDPLVYFDSRTEDSIPWTSPLQVYLDLATGGKRERETAEQIRERLLTLEYGGSND